jgi:hypothetical protein
MKQWCDFLDSNTEQASGDVKALWLLTRAGVASGLLSKPNPLAGQKWLDQALAAAASDTLRLRVLRVLVDGYIYVNSYVRPIGLLDSIAGQFGAEGRAEVEAMRKEIKEAGERYASAKALHDTEAAVTARTAWQQEIQKRLERARQRGNAEEIRRYEAMISRP